MPIRGPTRSTSGSASSATATGNTPILKVMKAAEQQPAARRRRARAYLGSAGDKRFAELLRPILLGAHADDERIAGLQTPGGCGALRLGFELIAHGQPATRGCWSARRPGPTMRRSSTAVGLEHRRISLLRPRSARAIRFDDDDGGARRARAPGDVVLLHGCCHNPTGADLDDEPMGARSTRVVARARPAAVRRHRLPGLRAAGSTRMRRACACMLDACDEVIIAQSCDKNFSVYRDRVGSLFLKTGAAGATASGRWRHVVPARARNVVDAARPWRRGGADRPRGLRSFARDWRVELGEMRDRINRIRQRIAAADPRLAYIGEQFGMFSMLPLSREQVLELRERPRDLHGRQRALQRRRHGRRRRSTDLSPPWSRRWMA